ncbi:hypothetical protein [Saccharibacillus kuerlensis]|uniref:Uncharacterized protein n=1 Tax=Saccharibacillus kuerlensis TaxID=459527 RepID=A0ABQ2L458_9BACL|nr:hypothetical protein [Saccharibacillus kuerlensis]GGO02089.1 hypothetical protein GCM10010969_25050 [Saccharibacillus kuerlensis]
MSENNLFFKWFAIPAATIIIASIFSPGKSTLASEANGVTQLPSLQITDPPFVGIPMASGALTSPPPIPPAQYYARDLANNKYLKDISSNIAALGNSSIYITAYSSGSPEAGQMGVTVTIQRWTGSSWVDLSSRTTNGSVSTTSSVSFSKAITKGYYYRVKTEHWASGAENRESRTLFSDTTLAN